MSLGRVFARPALSQQFSTTGSDPKHGIPWILYFAMRTINVVEYDPDWPRQFQAIRSRLVPAIGDIASAIEHVGSTAVPGLCAKPVIDIDVVVDGVHDMAEAIEKLAAIGYGHRGDLGIVGREAFNSPNQNPRHHLYVCLRGILALRNHLAIRDALRSNADVARGYGELKMQLASRFSNDIDRYIEGKTDFLLRILESSGFAANETDSIRYANRQEKTTASERHRT